MMRNLNFYEFQNLVEYLADELVGAQLQEVLSTREGICLSFYRYGKSDSQAKVLWLVLDMDNQFPFMGLFETNPWARLKTPKPVGLFLNSHFKNSVVTKIENLENLGRVCEIVFNTPDSKIEIRLIPKQPNVIVFHEGKQVSWNKPKELYPQKEIQIEEETRSLPFLQKQWLDLRSQSNARSQGKSKKGQQESSSGAPVNYEAWVADRQKSIEKKKKALEKIDQKIDLDLQRTYKALGEHLKAYGVKDLQAEWIPLYKKSETLKWNIQNSFDKYKQIESKKHGSAERKKVLINEIKHLENFSEEVYQQSLKKKAEQKQFQLQRKQPQGEFRKLVLDEAFDLFCLMGKSAADNLKLLRQAKSWDLWIHLKDYPSAYAIIFKNRDQKISDDQIRKAALWLAQNSVKTKDTMSTQVGVVIVECRHVRPIKGDKIGRVTYHHPREMLIRL